METSPARFSGKAKSIEVMGRGMFQIRPGSAGGYRLAWPLPTYAQVGDVVEIYHHDPEIDGQETELLASVAVQPVDREQNQIWVELSTEEMEVFLSEFGFGCAAIQWRKAGERPDRQLIETPGM